MKEKKRKISRDASISKIFVIASFVKDEWNEENLSLNEIEKLLSKELGNSDYQSPSLGSRLKNNLHGHPSSQSKIWAFAPLILREEFVHICHKIMKIEKKISNSFPVKIELELGYITEFHCVLSSLGEEINYNHIYLYGGMFAENIYFYEMMSFRCFNHTSLYFKNKKIITIFNDIHAILTNSL